MSDLPVTCTDSGLETPVWELAESSSLP